MRRASPRRVISARLSARRFQLSIDYAAASVTPTSAMARQARADGLAVFVRVELRNTAAADARDVYSSVEVSVSTCWPTHPLPAFTHLLAEFTNDGV